MDNKNLVHIKRKIKYIALTLPSYIKHFITFIYYFPICVVLTFDNFLKLLYLFTQSFRIFSFY